jgi:hypothetical protein
MVLLVDRVDEQHLVRNGVLRNRAAVGVFAQVLLDCGLVGLLIHQRDGQAGLAAAQVDILGRRTRQQSRRTKQSAGLITPGAVGQWTKPLYRDFPASQRAALISVHFIFPRLAPRVKLQHHREQTADLQAALLHTSLVRAQIPTAQQGSIRASSAPRGARHAVYRVHLLPV